jgi:hypothetical protein
MAIDFVQTYELAGLVDAMPRQELFLQKTFFNNEILTNKSKIILDDVIGINDFAARYVDPKMTPSPRKRNANKLREIEPAYVQESVVITPAEALERTAGEGLGGILSPNSRMQQLIAQEVKKQVDSVDTRLEIMASDSLFNAGYTISGEQYERVAISFGRSASLKPTALATTARWWVVSTGLVGSTATPLANIQSLVELQYSVGRTKTTDVVLGANARKGFMASTEVKNAIFDNNFRTSTAKLSIDPALYVGLDLITVFASGMRVWSYTNTYTNDAGTAVEMFDPNSIVLLDTLNYGGCSLFGVIQNMEANLQPMRVYSNMYMLPRGKGIEIVTESSPLLFPKRPNASASWVVAS